VFVTALLRESRIVPPVVGDALFEGLDASASVEDRRAVWIAGFRVAPVESTAALAAAIGRMDPAVREEAADVLEVVRHRAPRR
jgi:hypothetical protein